MGSVAPVRSLPQGYDRVNNVAVSIGKWCRFALSFKLGKGRALARLSWLWWGSRLHHAIAV